MSKTFKPDLSNLRGEAARPTDAMWTGSQMPNGTWVSSQEICEEHDRQRRAFEHDQFKKSVLPQADHSPDPVSRYALNVISDCREAIARGMKTDALTMLNELYVIIDARMSTKDEHGRHDYAPGEQVRKTKAKLEYLAAKRNEADPEIDQHLDQELREEKVRRG